MSGVHAGVAGSVAAALAAAGSAGFQGRRSLRAPVGTAAAPLRHTFVAPHPLWLWLLAELHRLAVHPRVWRPSTSPPSSSSASAWRTLLVCQCTSTASPRLARQNECNQARAEDSQEEGVSGVHAGVAGSVAAALAAAGSAGFQGRRSLRAPVGTAAAPLRHTFVAPHPLWLWLLAELHRLAVHPRVWRPSTSPPSSSSASAWRTLLVCQCTSTASPRLARQNECNHARAEGGQGEGVGRW